MDMVDSENLTPVERQANLVEPTCTTGINATYKLIK